MGGGILDPDDLGGLVAKCPCDFCDDIRKSLQKLSEEGEDSQFEHAALDWMTKHCVVCGSTLDLVELTEQDKAEMGYWPSVVKMCTNCLKEVD